MPPVCSVRPGVFCVSGSSCLFRIRLPFHSHARIVPLICADVQNRSLDDMIVSDKPYQLCGDPPTCACRSRLIFVFLHKMFCGQGFPLDKRAIVSYYI